jgi:biopolymer transport protein ExbB
LVLLAFAPLLLAQATAPSRAGAPGPATAAARDEEPTTTQTPRKSLLQWYLAGGAFMHPIALCSFLAVAIIIERFVSLRQGRVVPRDFIPGLKSRVRDLRNDAPSGLEYCRQSDSPIARTVAAGIRKAARGPEAVEKAMEDAGAAEAARLRTNMRFLYSLASIATLLGLIGTIQGMIMAFQIAEVTGTGKFGPLAEGIYTALITTFAGLLVAIPVTAFYYFFAGKIDRLVAKLNEAAGDFVDTYASHAWSPAAAGENGSGPHVVAQAPRLPSTAEAVGSPAPH